MREVEIGKRYRHFKGKTYKVLHIAYDSETNNDDEPRKLVTKLNMVTTLFGLEIMICFYLK